MYDKIHYNKIIIIIIFKNVQLDFFSTGCFDIYNWPLNNRGLNCTGPLLLEFFSLKILEIFLEICDSILKLADKACSLEILKNFKKKLGMLWMHASLFITTKKYIQSYYKKSKFIKTYAHKHIPFMARSITLGLHCCFFVINAWIPVNKYEFLLHITFLCVKFIVGVAVKRIKCCSEKEKRGMSFCFLFWEQRRVRRPDDS